MWKGWSIRKRPLRWESPSARFDQDWQGQESRSITAFIHTQNPLEGAEIMQIHKETDGEIRPCPHMRNWVSSLADGTLRGFPRWFTRLHVKGCPHCHEALGALQTLCARLSK